MPIINLVATDNAQQKVKSYLEKSASDELADKINNGVKISKDNKTLINKKDLNGFMRFANDEARKVSEKGQQYACIDDDVVYGWAIHYFEEDSIEGTLLNEDGSEYKKEIPKSTYSPTPKPVKVEKPKGPSLFDLLQDEENVIKPDITKPEDKPSQYVDLSTGEIFETKEDSIISSLKFIFGDALEVIK